MRQRSLQTLQSLQSFSLLEYWCHCRHSRFCEGLISLDKCIQYLTLAVNNAKSHPSSKFGRQEAVVEFLTDLEEKLEVAQVQREVCHSLTAKLGTLKGEVAFYIFISENIRKTTSFPIHY